MSKFLYTGDTGGMDSHVLNGQISLNYTFSGLENLSFNKLKNITLHPFKSNVPSQNADVLDLNSIRQGYEEKKKVLPESRPFVSLVIPAFNEASILEKNLDTICRYMSSIEDKYRWELIIINDGSTDDTAKLAEKFSKNRDNVRVLHHMFNSRIGQAFRTAFKRCKGDYVVTMDLDLSYSPDHIARMLDRMTATNAKIVIASPYMKGGKVSNVPLARKLLSRWANRFLSFFVKTPFEKPSTLTGMVRAYNREFLSGLSLKSMDVDIHCEIIYKAMILRALVVEIPAHLNWNFVEHENCTRKSHMRIFKAIMLNLIAGFMLRPFMFFLLPGILILLLAFYPIFWSLFHSFTQYKHLLDTTALVPYPFSNAIAAAFSQSPQSFIIGGIALIIGIQLIGLGFLSFQNKRNYEELFHLGSHIYESFQRDELWFVPIDVQKSQRYDLPD